MKNKSGVLYKLYIYYNKVQPVPYLYPTLLELSSAAVMNVVGASSWARSVVSWVRRLFWKAPDSQVAVAAVGMADEIA